MKKRTLTAVLCAALCLTGCSAAPAGTQQTETGQSAEQTAAEQTTEPQAAPETDAPPVTEPEQEQTVEVITEAVKTNKADTDTKILYSDRGLDATRINAVEESGEELKLGASYLDWTLESYDGVLADDAQSVVAMDADFSRESTLAVNGVMTVLSKDDPNYPNAMLLRVDNQADFPYFVNDYRERGKYIIQNSRDVFAMLELTDPPVDEQYELSVSVSVSALQIHMGSGDYDTIRVTAASKR